MKDVYLRIKNTGEKQVELVASEKTYPHKEDLKKLGFRFDGNFRDWRKYVEINTKEEFSDELRPLVESGYVEVDIIDLERVCKKYFGFKDEN